MTFRESALFKRQCQYLTKKETQALEAQLADLEENPKRGEPRFDIREGLYMLKYHDADGRKILSYRILSKTLIGLVSLNRISVGI